MRWLGVIWREVLGMFVDDGRFALAIAVFLLLAGLLLPVLALPHGLAGLLLFGGLALILVDSVIRRARTP